jgi:hypothetical protein
MPTFKTENITISNDGSQLVIVKRDNFESFSEDILGLGQIDVKSNVTNAISVFFDLEGFTDFCKQIDPHLAVPEYLSKFLKWIFNEIKVELTIEKLDEGYYTYAGLPFLSKFTGDGLLFLWNTEGKSEDEINNVVVSMYEICKKYKNKFLTEIKDDIVSPPRKLRCGIARGSIYSVGDGNDFVGPCINMSARLQKLHTLSFCFSRRGFDLKEFGDDYKKLFIVKKVQIRGIGDEELVCLLSTDYEEMDELTKKYFK